MTRNASSPPTLSAARATLRERPGWRRRLGVAAVLVRRPGAALRGVAAALRAPRWLQGPALQTLLAPAAPTSSVGTEADATGNAPGGATAEVRGPSVPESWPTAQKASYLALRVLARLPGGRWRDSCLYRSVASCLVLRGYGVPVQLRVGVRRRAGADPVHAHAWTVAHGVAVTPSEPGLVVLRQPSTTTHVPSTPAAQ